MIRLILLAAGLTLLVFGIGRIIYNLGKIKGANEPYSATDKKGLLAAIGAALIGILLIYKNMRKN